MSTAETSGIRFETEEVGPVLRNLVVELDPSHVKKAYDRAYRDLQKNAQVRGFRKGKVPRSVLERMYGASLAEEIERQLVSETLPDAIEQAELTPVAEPDIESDPLLPDAPFKYTARIQVKPEIELPELSGLPATKPEVLVADGDVDEQLDRMRDQYAQLLEEPEGTPAATGHHLKIDFVGRVDSTEFEGGTGRDVTVEIGAGRMVPGFEEQLVGAEAGGDRELQITFPDDYASEALRGQDAVFAVHVASVQRREVPELDDEFAKDVGDFDTLAALRGRVESDLRSQREQAAESALHRSVLEALVERTDFEVPVGMVDRELDHQMQTLHRQLHGQLPDEVLHAQLQRMSEEGREPAERRVREALLLEAIGKDRGFEASDEDVDARLEEMAAQRGMDPDQLKKMAREQDFVEAVRAEVLDRKALEFLVSEAKVEVTSAT